MPFPIESPTPSTHIPMGSLRALGSPPRSKSTNMSINYPMVSPTPSTHVPMGALRALGSPPRSKFTNMSINYPTVSPTPSPTPTPTPPATGGTQVITSNIQYGQGATAGGDIDLFLDLYAPEASCDTNRPTVVFVHGGYWRRFDKSYWSHFSHGALAQGWRVVMPSYDLCPRVTIAEITQQMRSCVTQIAEKFAFSFSISFSLTHALGWSFHLFFLFLSTSLHFLSFSLFLFLLLLFSPIILFSFPGRVSNFFLVVLFFHLYPNQKFLAELRLPIAQIVV